MYQISCAWLADRYDVSATEPLSKVSRKCIDIGL
jgi:hypothetical protein